MNIVFSYLILQYLGKFHYIRDIMDISVKSRTQSMRLPVVLRPSSSLHLSYRMYAEINFISLFLYKFQAYICDKIGEILCAIPDCLWQCTVT